MGLCVFKLLVMKNKVLTSTEGEECISIPVSQEPLRFKCVWVFPILSCHHASGRHSTFLL